MRNPQIAGGEDAARVADGEGTVMSFFAAMDADDGSPRQKSPFAHVCLYWTKRIFCTRSRWHYLIFLCIYSYLIGPVYLNWAPLRELLFRSGAYAWECDPNEQDPNSLRYLPPGEDSSDKGGKPKKPVTCTLQRLRVGNLYTVCAAADFGFSFFGGLVVDWLGPKTGSLLGSTSMLAGWLLLALSGESAPLYLPGMVLFGIGIDMAFYGTISLSRLFPGRANTVIAVLAGMRGLGLMSPLILNSLPFSFTVVMLGYALLGLLPAVLIASVYAPWKPFQGEAAEEKKKRQQRSEALLAGSSDRSGSDLVLDSASCRIRHGPSGDLDAVGPQETAADFSPAERVPGQHADGQTHVLLLQHATDEGQPHYHMTQHGRQGPQQLEHGVGRGQEGDEKPLAARPTEVQSSPTEVQKGPASDEKQLLLQRRAGEAGEIREPHFSTAPATDAQEQRLMDADVSLPGGSRLFRSRPEQQQENPVEDVPGARRRAGDWQHKLAKGLQEEDMHVRVNVHGDIWSRGCWQQDASDRDTTSDAWSRRGSTTIPPLPLSVMQHPGAFFEPANSSSAVWAQAAAAASPVRAKEDSWSAATAVSSSFGTAASTAGNRERFVRTERERAAEGLATPLPEEQQGSRVKITPRAEETWGAERDESTWRELHLNLEEAEQRGPPTVFHQDSQRNSKERLCPPFSGGSRRLLSKAADEDSIAACRPARVEVSAERTFSAEKWEPAGPRADDVGGGGAVSAERSPARGEGSAAKAATTTGAAFCRRDSSTTQAGWNVELGAVLDSSSAAPRLASAAVRGSHEPPNEDHGSALLHGPQIPLRRSVSSRQFPRTCKGRMRYYVAYLRLHPWTVQSVDFTRDYLFTILYLPVVPYFAFSLMRSVYFSDASEDLVPSALSTLHVLLAFVCVVPPLMGLLADVWTIMPCLVLVNTTGTLVMLGSLAAHLTHVVAFEYLAVIFYMPFAALLTNQVYFYVADTFPQRHLGKLCGFACSIGGVVSLSVTSMFEFSVKTKGGFTIMLCLMVGISLLCYGLIAVLYVALRRSKRTEAAAAGATATALDAAGTAAAAAETSAKVAPSDAVASFAPAAATQRPGEGPLPPAAMLQQNKGPPMQSAAAASFFRKASIEGLSADRDDADVQENPAV